MMKHGFDWLKSWWYFKEGRWGVRLFRTKGFCRQTRRVDWHDGDFSNRESRRWGFSTRRWKEHERTWNAAKSLVKRPSRSLNLRRNKLRSAWVSKDWCGGSLPTNVWEVSEGLWQAIRFFLFSLSLRLLQRSRRKMAVMAALLWASVAFWQALLTAEHRFDSRQLLFRLFQPLAIDLRNKMWPKLALYPSSGIISVPLWVNHHPVAVQISHHVGDSETAMVCGLHPGCHKQLPLGNGL